MKHDERIIVKLNKIAWWNWEEQVIKNIITDFYLPIDQFVEKYYEN